ncbi:hypothetical protein LPB72_11900 [Hydrogenophaga crassostreae]|uniref:DUF4189 domain-containing protein n=1 Tax=Hydrogenophaga crassostreae TaxID=1763535 RepID=A0A167I0K4_9BURK|nr:DUF4189 domain-containing protein [Hydrogenophaga crassostreae]AOW13676.1 hypothetical protein LPB072_13280 [Hydrogenophaga crassostreae]OAD41972.1 hypothetical protein LPB72_11900 [Hydrogenophaga crassostreae]
MLATWKLAIAIAITSTLVACGGGGASSTPRGAIAVNPSSGFGAISTFYTSQPEANSDAVAACGSVNCVVALEFTGAGECGSIAWSRDSIWGVGSAGSKEQADKIAVAQCVANGGSACFVASWLRDQCN